MTGIVAPKRVRPESHSGRPKAGYIFQMLRIRGFEPFDPVGQDHTQVRVGSHEEIKSGRARAIIGDITGSHKDVRLSVDKHGVPIQRMMLDGDLMDVTWWKGRISEGVCQGCTVADGRAREVVRTIRPARIRRDNRVPTVKTAGFWHLGCLRLKLQKHGRYGRDVRQVATDRPVTLQPVRDQEQPLTLDIRNPLRTNDVARPVARPSDPNAELRMAWVRFRAARLAYLKGMGGYRVRK